MDDGQRKRRKTEDFKDMITRLRVPELQTLLSYAGKNKAGKKVDLQSRALRLLQQLSPGIQDKILELHNSGHHWPNSSVLATMHPYYRLDSSSYGSSEMKESSQSGFLDRLRPRTSRPDYTDYDAKTPETGYQQQQQQTAMSCQGATAQPSTVRKVPPAQPAFPRTIPPTTGIRPTYPVQIFQRLDKLNTSIWQRNGQSSQSYHQYPKIMGSSSGPISCQQYPFHPDVQLQNLPFYDTLETLIKPSSLASMSANLHVGRIQESTFTFYLTPQQVSAITTSYDRMARKYQTQVLVRLCLIETTCPQEDRFPPGLRVLVNNAVQTLPPLTQKRPGDPLRQRPVPLDVTPLVRLSSYSANSIAVLWEPECDRGYALAAHMVRRLNPSDLLRKLRERGMRNADFTRALIKEKLVEDADCEIATTSLRVSLVCPLGKVRMTTPCRASTCGHLQCFDAALYLQMNEFKPSWQCPVCDKAALYENLALDGYFQEVLKTSPTNCNEIQLLGNGSWAPLSAKKQSTVVLSTLVDDGVEVLSDDQDVVPLSPPTAPAAATSAATASKPKATEKDPVVVDLTLSDSEDEPQVLDTRAEAASPPKPPPPPTPPCVSSPPPPPIPAPTVPATRAKSRRKMTSESSDTSSSDSSTSSSSVTLLDESSASSSSSSSPVVTRRRKRTPVRKQPTKNTTDWVQTWKQAATTFSSTSWGQAVTTAVTTAITTAKQPSANWPEGSTGSGQVQEAQKSPVPVDTTVDWMNSISSSKENSSVPAPKITTQTSADFTQVTQMVSDNSAAPTDASLQCSSVWKRQSSTVAFASERNQIPVTTSHGGSEWQGAPGTVVMSAPDWMCNVKSGNGLLDSARRDQPFPWLGQWDALPSLSQKDPQQASLVSMNSPVKVTVNVSPDWCNPDGQSGNPAFPKPGLWETNTAPATIETVGWSGCQSNLANSTGGTTTPATESRLGGVLRQPDSPGQWENLPLAVRLQTIASSNSPQPHSNSVQHFHM